jgi:hypothetical protein
LNFSKIEYMTRRELIKQLAILTGGVLLLPSCKGEKEQTVLKLSKLKLTETQLNSIMAMADVIIPATNTPGAKELSIYKHILLMVNDCSEAKEQETFVKGLTEAQAASEKKYQKKIQDLSKQDITTLLNGFEEAGKTSDTPLHSFYKKFRRATIDGYRSSEHVMKNILKYQLVPGKFQGKALIG